MRPGIPAGLEGSLTRPARIAQALLWSRQTSVSGVDRRRRARTRLDGAGSDRRAQREPRAVRAVVGKMGSDLRTAWPDGWPWDPGTDARLSAKAWGFGLAAHHQRVAQQPRARRLCQAKANAANRQAPIATGATMKSQDLS